MQFSLYNLLHQCHFWLDYFIWFVVSDNFSPSNHDYQSFPVAILFKSKYSSFQVFCNDPCLTSVEKTTKNACLKCMSFCFKTYCFALPNFESDIGSVEEKQAVLIPSIDIAAACDYTLWSFRLRFQSATTQDGCLRGRRSRMLHPHPHTHTDMHAYTHIPCWRVPSYNVRIC